MLRNRIHPSSVFAALLLLTACDQTLDPVVAPDLAPTTIVGSSMQSNSTLMADDVHTVFGPRLFARSTGTPTTETVTLEGYAPDATLRIANGDASGGFLVTSGTVLVDGKEVVHPSDFGKKVASITTPIALLNTSIISVRLAGSPGDQLTLAVDGRFATVAAITNAGGTIHLLGGQVTLEIPAGSVSGSVDVTAAPAPPPTPGVVPNTTIDLGPSGTTFSSPVTVSIAFDPSTLPLGIGPASLRMKWWNHDHWEDLPDNSVDLQRGVVSARTTHFSTFALLANELVFCPGDVTAEDDLQTAISRVPEGGTVYVCDGVHLITPVVIDKPLTVTAEGPGMPTLDAGGASRALLVAHVPSGAVTISKLRFTGGTRQQVLLLNDLASATIADNEFLTTESYPYGISGGNKSIGLLVSGTGISSLTIDHNTFLGGDVGLYMSGAFTGVGNVRRNSFRGMTESAVELVVYQSGSSLTSVNVEENAFEDCGFYHCIWAAVPARIVANTFVSHIERPIMSAITFGAQPGNQFAYTVTDNTIVGIGKDPSSPYMQSTYPITMGGIVVHSAVADVSRNHITNAYRGIVAIENSVFSGDVTAFDNVIQTTFLPISVLGPTPPSTLTTTLTANWNDFTDSVVGILGTQNGVLNLRCNWWGQSGGPTLNNSSIPPSVYTPFAMSPVAGQAHTGCTL